MLENKCQDIGTKSGPPVGWHEGAHLWKSIGAFPIKSTKWRKRCQESWSYRDVEKDLEVTETRGQCLSKVTRGKQKMQDIGVTLESGGPVRILAQLGDSRQLA